MIRVETGAATSAGRVRTVNEDDYVAAPPVFVVADGMGGHAAGEVASGLATAEFRTLAGQAQLSAADVQRVLDQAHDRICWRAEAEPDRRGMGTTVTGLVGVQQAGTDHWLVFNVGDSRVYRFAGGSLTQLSTDHSEVEELVGAGTISREEARSHPRRNVVTRSLGTGLTPRPDLWLLPPTVGERFLICSDGLVNEVDDDRLVSELRSTRGAQQLADRLVAAAVAAGGRDNVTVVVVDVVGTDDDGADEDTVPREAAV